MSPAAAHHTPALRLAGRAAIAFTVLHAPPREAAKPGLQLRELRRHLAGTTVPALARARAALIEPVASFADDIVVPVFRSDTVPLVALCAPAAARCPELVIRWPKGLGYFAEGERHALPDAGAGIRFAWRDSVALFESGHVAYTFSLLPLPGDPAAGLRDAHEYDLLLLQKLADPTEAAGVERDGVLMPLAALPCFVLDGGAAGSVAGILETRLAALRKGPEGQVLRLLLDAATLSEAESPLRATPDTVIAGALVHIDRAAAEIGAIRAFFADGDREGDGEGDRVRALAGLVQNILDFPRQDVSEIGDSLDPVFDESGILVFNHPRILTEISVASRSFSRMQSALGACPYLLLTHLVLLYNERLLVDVEAELAGLAYEADADAVRVAPLAHLFGLLDAAAQPTDGRARKRFAESLRQRLQVFRGLLLPYIPNVFRYRTERTLYDALGAGRGLSLRRDRFVMILDQHERSVNDLHGLTKMFSDRRLNLLLFVVALLTLLSVVKDVQQIFVLPPVPGWARSGLSTLVLAVAMMVLSVVGWPLFVAWCRRAWAAVRPGRR